MYMVVNELVLSFLVFFFFQAEDGIRDSSVTGVQTCALPISIGGTPYPNNTIPMAQWNRNAPAFIKMLNFVSRANATPTPGIPEQVRIPFSPTYVFDKNAKVARVDYNISPNMNFFFRWSDDAQQDQQDIGIFNILPY